MKLFGVTGHPILHSLSPEIFAGLFASDGADAAYLRVAARTLDDALGLARRIGVSGLNVTSPFKEAAYRLATARDQPVSRLGAANTLLLEPGAVRAFNTDPVGVRRALSAGGIAARGTRVVVLGSGGAALAAGATLADDGADVVVVSRTPFLTAETAQRLGCTWADLQALPDLLAKASGLVSCLPHGVDPVAEGWLHAGLWVLDSDYYRSSLARKARRCGCTVLDGIDWLVGQALAAQRLFANGSVAGTEAEEGQGIEAGEALTRLAREADGRPAKPKLALAGMMGVGKSTVGRELARRLGRELADSDDLIVERTGRDIRWLFEHRSEEEFRRIEAETIARIVEGDAPLIALGGGSLQRQATKALVRGCCRVVWLWAAPACLAGRLTAQAHVRPLLDGADLEPRLASLLAVRTPTYAAAADLVVDAEPPVEDVVDLVTFEACRVEE